MKVVLLNRARGEFWSIEELFETISHALPASVECRTASVPKVGASLRALVQNAICAASIKNADIVHVTGDIHYSVIGMWRMPSILTIHDLRFIEEQKGIKRQIFWLLWIYLPCKFASKITVISNFTKRRLQSWVTIRGDKVSVIPDCVNPDFKPFEKSRLSDPPVILHVGTTPNKNLERLIHASTGLDIELWILGRLSSEQKKLLNKNGVRWREHFDLQRSEVIRLYQNCDIVSFVSLYEGFGMPILEAQAVGRPVLTSTIAPMDEVSGPGALHVDPTNVDSIKNGLMQLLQDPELREELVQQGFRNVCKYSAESVARQYHDLYLKTLA